MIGLRYLDPADALPYFYQIGWERHVGTEIYDWDCQTRTDRHYLFAYTSSGRGELHIEGRCISLTAGHAFLIEVPGPYRYRLPDDSAEWELKFLCMTVDFVPTWHRIVEKSGRVLTLLPGDSVMRLFDQLYTKAAKGDIEDVYSNSASLYRFLMALMRAALPSGGQERLESASVRRCVEFIRANPGGDVTLDDLAQLAGLSKYHLTREFERVVGDTPIQYLIKTRIRMASQFLVQTNHTIEEIAALCGYSNGNYFAKVFRRWMGVAPSEFRTYAREQRMGNIVVK